jgi:pre-60S factor REI1
MSKNHNFFIPDQDYLIDLSSFLSFLNTIISEFHQCLFCGSERSNKWAAQDHMKSKGHCRIDVEEEEWEDFWYFPEPEGDDVEDKEQDGDSEFLEIGGDDEIRLPSGKTLRHRSQARYFRRNPNRTALPAPAPRQLQQKNAETSTESRAPSSGSTPSASATTTSTSSDRQLVMRAGTSTSLVGLPELQVRALQTTEMKAMQMETRARNRYQAVLERGGNSQKHFKVCRRLERGKAYPHTNLLFLRVGSRRLGAVSGARIYTGSRSSSWALRHSASANVLLPYVLICWAVPGSL